VCPDADLARAVPSIAAGGFFNAGQVCVASKRIYVHASIFDEFLDALVAEVQKSYAIQADASVPSAFGPLSNQVQYKIIQDIIEDCRKNGYKIVTGGEINIEKKGYWVPPTIVSKPAENSWLVKEEQFGEFGCQLKGGRC